jgi:aminobenzoyl-glutamate utilization protein A
MSTSDTDRLVALRREFHRHAELPFLEVRTAARVLAELGDIADSAADAVTVRWGREAMRADAVADYPDQATRERAGDAAVAAGADPEVVRRVVDQGTAVIADITGNRPGPSWAVRFDVDALPITESADADHPPAAGGFRCEAGTMHACGHDGHTAVGLVLARRLADRDFPGSVRLLFQPAEEGCRGATAMIAAGAVRGIDRFLALHLGNSLPTGTMVGTAVDLQATVKFAAEFTGVAAHAAGGPQHGRNALAAAATATTALLGLPRSSDGVTNVNVGTLHGGSATNIIPDAARLTGEVRSDAETVCSELFSSAERVLDASAAMYGVQVRHYATARSTTLASDDLLVDQVLRIAVDRFGPDPVRRTAVLSASDDASLLAAEVQRAGGLSSYLLVGSGNPAPHHHPRFDIDEASLPIALDWLTDIVRRNTPPPAAVSADAAVPPDAIAE